MAIKTKTKTEILYEHVQVTVEGLIETEIIKECPSPQCREYMINKNLEYTRRKITEAIDEVTKDGILRIIKAAPYNAPQSTGTLHKSKHQIIYKCDTCRHHISTVYQDKYLTIRRCTTGHETPKRGCSDYVEG